MARLIIKDYAEEVRVKEKILGLIPWTKTFINSYLSVNRPNKQEERIFLAKQIVKYNVERKKYYHELVGMDMIEYERQRTLKIQDLVNRLEKEGFYVRTDQLALFISLKIDNLILDSK